MAKECLVNNEPRQSSEEKTVKECEFTQFERRVRAFSEDYENGRNFEVIVRHGTKLKVGTGDNEGLVIGKSDLMLLQEVMEKLHRLYKETSITPRHYVLKDLKCFSGVQEFIETPTLSDLIFFLKGKDDSTFLGQVSEQAQSLCKEFLNKKENCKIDLDLLNKADQELYEHSTALVKYGRRTIFAQRNVLVLGQEKDGRVIIAPIDIE
jgi:hypothetical protein